MEAKFTDVVERIDCVLIFPPWTSTYSKNKILNCLPPLGVLSIASYVRNQGFSVKVIDVHAEELSPHEIRKRIRQYWPKYVGISVLTPMIVAAHAIAKLVKEEVPDCTIAFGGVHAEVDPSRVLRNSAVDLVGMGDGEQIMGELCD